MEAGVSPLPLTDSVDQNLWGLKTIVELQPLNFMSNVQAEPIYF